LGYGRVCRSLGRHPPGASGTRCRRRSHEANPRSRRSFAT